MAFVAALTSATPSAGDVCTETVRVSLGSSSSGSSSFVRTSTVSSTSSSVLPKSSTASGGSFTSVTVIVTPMVSVPPLPSSALTVAE